MHCVTATADAIVRGRHLSTVHSTTLFFCLGYLSLSLCSLLALLIAARIHPINWSIKQIGDVKFVVVEEFIEQHRV